MIQGFKDFISRGNAIDLAVGMIIGAAFTGVVTALVEKVINPLIGGLIGKPNFDNFLEFHIGDALVQPGAIITALVNFLLIAFALYFFLVVPMNKLNDMKKKPADEGPAQVSDEVKLLQEIRDSLVTRNSDS
ncbi:large conductance mechanosensitive channel protein MscL [Schaalia sp. ZJ405]|uniref:large conductance mechanosensitive channel protein MscL n=1 Tax=unclassified Schaalia TaxID=2691889 RepID=UPI0013EE2D02|nr:MULTISPECIES: large conductance mechanosensitive channel protein MscL [unclassified Schaalia]QPK81015.1 large conductance mechanosensitive channel protein MscL [Schaalia sp. ZJ405]